MSKAMTIGVTLGVLCVAGLAAWRIEAQTPAPPPTPPPPPPVPVVAQRVEVSDMPIIKVGIGTVVAYNVVDVHAQVAGTIQKIGFVEGQTVHPGDLIAQIDPRPYQASLQQAEANLIRDQAHLVNAQSNLGRYVPLQKQGFATEQEVGDQAASVDELRAAIASDNAAITNARTQLSYTTITAPIDGVTGILNIDIGNLVQPSTTTPIVTLAQIQPISVIFTLPQNDVPLVQVAMAKGPLTTIAYSQDGTTALGQGTLLLVDNKISRSSGAVQLKATFPNANRALWPGEFVDVRLVIDTQHNALSVPLDALQQGQAGSLVYVVGSDNTVQSHPVTIAETLDGRALIGQGLQEGDTVVTAGQYRLSDGVKVTLTAAGDPHVQNQTPATQGMLQ